jgi:L-aspartate oxidase
MERTKGEVEPRLRASSDVFTIKERAPSEISPVPLSLTALQLLLWNKAGIVRDRDGLEEAIDTLIAWQRGLGKPSDRPSYELSDMLLVGRLLTEAALLREESRGAHFRSDFPHPSEAWKRHIVFMKTG